MIVYKKFHIESARSLPNLPNEHPCSQIHGHSFEIILKVSGELNEKTGFIIDFQEIEDSFNPIRLLLDHAYLNNIKGLENPTSENMCKYIWGEIKPAISGLVEIEIKETHSTGCIYKGD
tara:strand:+ start:1786 stop:2142 length:357 start_codon:yes stop_codon:yes gene_type:complete